MVFAEHFSNNAGGFLVRLGVGETQLIHRKKDPSMHRLQAIPDIRKRAPHNDRHRVVDVRILHFFFDRSEKDFFIHRIQIFFFRHNFSLHRRAAENPRRSYVIFFLSSALFARQTF
ncbi:MAG: hypothetical protein BWY42_01325 [Candidatus Omnitrophica bacterium ADurb.Bin277]|nr:MAG: hypothetical protein BWY42_01325 [Candidatus Omnitrophica bacterium ADurb.Bin277]